MKMFKKIMMFIPRMFIGYLMLIILGIWNLGRFIIMNIFLSIIYLLTKGPYDLSKIVWPEDYKRNEDVSRVNEEEIKEEKITKK